MPKCVRRSFRVSVGTQWGLTLAVLVLATCALPAPAQLVRLGQIEAYNDNARTPGLAGVVFDEQGRAIVLDRLGWTLSQVGLTNANVVSTRQPAPASYPSMGGLAYQPSTGKYYTVGISSFPFLATVDPAAGTVTGDPTTRIGVSPSFTSLAFDNAGTLWLLSGDRNGELWTIDPATGRGTFKTLVNYPAGIPRGGGQFSGAITALSINDRNQFVMAGTLGDGLERIFQVDPATGNATLLGETGRSSLFDNGNTPTRLVGLAYESATGRYFGVENASGTFYLSRVLGVPEPSGVCAALAGAALLLRRRRQRCG